MDELTVEGSVRLNLRRADGTPRCWAAARSLLLILPLALVGQCALAQAMYRIKPLGTLGGSCSPYAFGFNAADEVTGYACNVNGDEHAFLWKNNGNPMVDLGPDEVGSSSQGNALNASGLVAGYASDSTGTYGFVSSGNGPPWKRSQMVSAALTALHLPSTTSGR